MSWQDRLPGGGVVASDQIEIVVDVEAILLFDLEATGAIDPYREISRPAPRASSRAVPSTAGLPSRSVETSKACKSSVSYSSE